MKQDGTLGEISLKHDIGYGCGEEALRLTRLMRNWFPAQVFDSIFTSRREIRYQFCPQPELITLSDHIYEERDLIPFPADRFATIKRTGYDGAFVIGPYILDQNAYGTVQFDNTVVEMNFVIEPDGHVSETTVLNNPGNAYVNLAKSEVLKCKFIAGYLCSRNCRMRVHRYICFTKIKQKAHIIIAPFDPAQAPDFLYWLSDEKVYGPTEVDTPALYKTGASSIEERWVLYWPNRKKEMPKGKIKIKVQIEQNGEMNAKMLQGLGEPWDEIAIQKINALDWWTPAYKNGRPVRSWQILQIHR